MALFCLAGCRRDAADESTKVLDPPSEETASDISSAEIDRLRSLGYTDFAEEPAEEGNEGTIVFDRRRSYPGSNLYTIRHHRRTELVDAHGRLINAWQRGTKGRWVRSLLLPDGDLLVIGADLPHRFVLRLNWNNELVWELALPAHHDIAPAPSGRLMVLTLKPRLVPAVHRRIMIRDDIITLISNKGEVLEERSFYDMFSARPDLNKFIEANYSDGLIDLFHANSVRWLTDDTLAARNPIYSTRNVIVSFRHQDTVAIFDWDKSEVVWAWGHGIIRGPHDAAVLDNGHILLFDNGLGRKWSRVIELDPLTRTIVWEYKADPPSEFYTASRGANQRLPNGNTLITESGAGRAFEVTHDGQIVWEYLVPHYDDEHRRATIIRLYRYDPEFVDRIIHEQGELNQTGGTS